MVGRKTVLLSMALMFIASFSIWGGGNQSRNTTSTGTGSTSLRGANITIGNWWGDWNVNTFVPRNAAEERTLEWRTRIQREHGFTMEEKHVAGWGEMAQLAAVSIMAGDPAASVLILQPDWGMTLLQQGLAYPISDNTAVDLKNPQPVQPGVKAPEWSQSTIDAFTVRGKIYGFASGVNMYSSMVFFNKRLFREAGLDPELPYNMQRDGTWTWENFLSISRRLTRDINNDGIIDTYATTRDFSVSVLEATVASNDATYVDRDANGRFVNAMNRPEFLESLQFAIRMNNEGIMKHPTPDQNWDWFTAEFIDGKVAMRIAPGTGGELRDMVDDWGVVFFPKGPRTDVYIKYTQENVMMVPATFTPEQVNQIMLAMAYWVTPLEDDWRNSYWDSVRDVRAVNETFAILRNPPIVKTRYQGMIPFLDTGAGLAWSMWSHEGDPAQLIEAVSPGWNVRIAEVNNDLFR